MKFFANLFTKFLLGCAIGAVLGVIVSISLNTFAAPNPPQYPYVSKDENLLEAGAATGGTLISAAAFNAGNWGGWVYSERQAAICFDILYTRSTATGVTMRCETSQLSSTANDGGYDLHAIDVGAGTANSYLVTWTYTGSATARWTWCVDDPPGRFLNCLFDDVASGGANDLLTVVARGVSP